MKKAIAAILSVLMLISCLTVNVFAEGTEAQDSANPPAVQTISSGGSENNQATQNTENTESMNLVISGTDENNQPETITVPLTKRIADDGDNSGYEWYISPGLDMFSQGGYLDFCKHIANKGETFYLEYTPKNGQKQTVQSTDITISEPGTSNYVKRVATVFETTVVFAEYTKQDLLYARSVYYDNNEIRYSGYTPTSQDGPINIEIYNSQRYILYYGNDYDLDASTDDIVLNLSTEGIGIGTNENFNIDVVENNIFEVSSTRSGSNVNVSYAGQALTFTSILPDVGIYKSTERSDSSYCKTYNDNNRVFYINWDNNFIGSITLNTIRRNNNYTFESNEYNTTLIENANSLKIEFNEGINIEGGLEIQLTVSPRYGNSYPYNTRIDYEAGDTLYARNIYYGENNEIRFNEHAETSFNGDIFVDIYNNQKYALYFGSHYENSTSPDSERIKSERIESVTITENSGMTISQSNDLLSVYSENSGSHATIAYNGKSLTFRSRLPEFGIYTSNVMADETYCAKYNDNRREFYINWDNSLVNSVSIVNVNGYGPDSSYSTTDYVVTPNSNSLKLSFIDGVDITKGGLLIKLSVNYKNGHSNEFYIGCQYDSEYIENADYIIRDNQIFYSTVFNNRTYYVSKDIFSKFDSIKDNLSINEETQNILISFSNTDNYEMNNNSVFFDHGVYFRIDKILSLSAYNVSNPATDELTADNKISFTNPIVLDIDYRNTGIDYAETNTYLFTKTDGIYNKTYNKVSNNTNQGNSTLQANEYYWYGDQYTTSIKLSSNFYEPIVFATRLYDSDFKVFNDNFSIQIETISSQEDLQNKIDLQFTVGGSELTLGDNITLNKDLRITNFADFSMNDVGSNNFNNSLLIDLNGKTINLGNYKIILSENSTVHIKNGKIIGNSDSLIDNYGGLSLHDVDLINESESESSYAIKTYRGAVFIDENTTINSYNGINLSDSYYYNTFDNSCLVSGSINVVGNGVVFEEKETYNQDFLNVMVPNYINQEIQNNNYQVLNDIEPKVIAGGTAIITSNKTNIILAGTSYYEEADDGTNVEYLAKTTIRGNKAILVKSGELRIGGNIDIISNTTGDTNIEVVSSGLNNDDFLDININVSQKTNFVSYGNLIKETGTAGRNISLVITCQEHINDSKFDYVDNNPFKFNSEKVSYNITAGLYSTNGIGSYMDANEYRLVGPNSGFYEIIINSNDPYDFEYEWNDNQSSLANLNNLEYYLTNLGTKNIYIKSFNNTSVTPKTFTITRSKNILIDDGVTLNDVTFVVDANGKEVHINNGTINNTSGTCLVVENGEVYINSNLVSNGSTEAVKVTDGELHFDPGASAKGSVALNIEATSSVPKVDVCGDLEGTSGVAIKYVISDNLTVDYDSYALNIVGQNNPNGYSTIRGGILAENGKVTTMHANIAADVAFKLQGNSQIVFGKDTHVIGNETGVLLNGSGAFFFSEGILESKHPVVILDNADSKYQVVFKDRVRCKVLENGSGRVINTINNTGEIRNTNERISYNAYCELAYFNVPVDEKQFNNLNLKMNQGTAQEGMYKCVQYKNINNPNDPYAYTIGYKLESVKHNSLHLDFTNNNEIKVDSSRLDYLLKNQDDDVWTLLVTEEAEIEQKPAGMLEAYDIQVRKVNSEKEVELLTETGDYQNIIIPVDKDDVNKITVSHKHKDEDTINLQKLTKEEALKFTKECYYVNNDSSIGIITKRFSIFGIIANNEVVLPVASEVKNPTVSKIQYQQKLSEANLSEGWNWGEPDTIPNAGDHTYAVYKTITDDDKYDYSVIEGYNANNHRVERNITITVEKATPTVSHPAIKATYGDTFGSIKLENRFSFKDKNSSNSVGNAGEYNVTLTYTPEDSNNYKSVDVNVKLTVEKAYPTTINVPTNISAVEEGTKLSSIDLNDNRFEWKNPDAVVSDTNVALYTKDENHKTIEVNIPIAIKKTILVNGSNIKAVFTTSANNNASTTLPNTATTVTISNDALTLNAEKVVNGILNNNLGKIEIGENDVNDIKNIVSGVKTNDSLTLVVETVLNKEEKKIEEIDGESFNKISSALNGNEVLSLFDLKVNLNVSSKNSSNSVIDSSTTTISVLEVPLEIRIDVDTDELPVAPENKQIEYFVIPLHDGVALDPIPATLINGKLVFVANKFSYYTLSYKLVDIPTIPSLSGSGNRKPVVNTASH